MTPRSEPIAEAPISISALFGCSDHTPALQVFAVFSLSLGGTAGAEAETPASARGH